MQALFSPPKMPALQPPPVAPTVDDTRQAEEDMMRLRRRRGLASTFLFGRGKPSSSASAMLGAGTSASPSLGTGGASGGGASGGGKVMAR